jgi:hypothetical protein
MSRPHWARGTLLVTLVLAAGCQDYNFNPVGHCLIQPGTRRVTLSNISSADVLFVVDDSGSMGGEQSLLASSFSRFIGNLDAANEARRTAGLEPFDFHIAVTSTSMFWNQYTDARPGGPYTCSSSCPGAAGQLVCCTTTNPTNSPVRTAKACTPGVTACPTGTTCGTNCNSPYAGSAALKGENYCCDQATGGYPSGYVGDTMACSRAGTECGTFETHYNFAGCGEATQQNGVAINGWPYPQGDFVSWTSGATANPRVLHFDKELYPATPNPSATNKQGFTRQQLIDFFSGGGTVQGNVRVGVCGSGEEQALGAARRALEKARDGLQKDTYARASATPSQTWNATTRTPGSAADWLTPGAASKLVVVFVGDEDDCSPSASDASGAVVWDYADNQTGQDSCALDASRTPPLGGKLFPVDDFVTFFTGLGREVAAGFILPAAQAACSLSGDVSVPACTSDGLCCPPATSCGGNTNNGAYGRGIRLLDTAHALASRGVDVVAGSICQPFGDLLDSIAEIVKPPSGLALPSVPAAGEVTMLRIVDSGGQTRKVCTGPLTGAYTLAAAQATGTDWWFTDSANPAPPAAGATQNVYINPAGSCQANPGETYSADYLGRLPAGGCLTDAECGSKLGGEPGSWTCFAGVTGPGACVTPTASAPGTCICGARAQNCPNG